MDKKTKSNFIGVLAISLILTGIFLMGLSYYHNDNTNIKERNYESEVLLKISPNMEARNPTSKDIDTKLNLQTQDGSVYRLYESRDFITYGKTFVVKQ